MDFLSKSYSKLGSGFYYSAPRQVEILTAKNYSDTNFVNIVLEKPFYTRVETIAEKLGATPDTIINNALLVTLKKLEVMAQSRTKR